MMINLCNHSYYSLLMSSISIDDIISYAVKNNHKYVVLTDFNAMYGAAEFYNKAQANNLKPIIGLHIIEDSQYIYLLAKNNQGYKDLMKFSSLKMEGDVEAPTINKLIKNCFLITEDINQCKLNFTDGFSLNQKCKNPIASHPVYFLKKTDIKIWKSIRAIAEARLLDEYNDFHDYDEFYLDKEVKYSDEAIKNLNKVLDSCSWSLELNKNRYILDYAGLEHKNSRLMLQDYCIAGLKKQLKIKDGQVPVTYAKRLKYELDVINSMGFNNYFLVVQDYVNYAKDHGILVGPGRGSAAGSLVSYLLGITEIDPIKHDLIFERFLNPERVTMPDIDVDFMDSRRNEVVEYLFNKYGKEHVAHIIIFQRIKIKMALRDVGRILDIDNKIVGKICSLVVDDAFGVDEQIKPSKQLQQAIEDYPELFAIASRLINFPRQMGLHAAGVVLSNVPLNDVVPTQPSSDGILCTQYSMEYLEPLGLIKMDILGLANLTSLDLILKKIEVNKGIKINLKDIDLNNKDVFKYISAGNTTGIFQLESKGMTDVIRKVKPKSIEDISVCSALFRPGPQKNIPTYVYNREHPDQIKYLNDDIKKILAPTYGIIVYQEQIIQIVQKIAGFSLAEADLFRRAISKKKVDALSKLKTDFINGGIKQGYDKKLVETIFDTIFEFANYGFNHSHSLAYSYISYWLAWLAYFYPLEFYTTILTTYNPNSKDISEYVQQAKNVGIKVLQPDINISEMTFTNTKDSIIFGLNSIKGIGYSVSTKILEIRNAQPNKKFATLIDAIKKLTNGGESGLPMLKTLTYAGAFDSLLKKDQSRFWLINNIDIIFENCENIQSDGSSINFMDYNNAKPTEDNIKELNIKQEDLIGFCFSEDPIIEIKTKYKGEWKLSTISQIVTSNDFHSYFHVLVRINSIRETMTKTGKKMAFASIKDETFQTSATIFPGAYEKFSSLLKKNNYVLLTVKNDTYSKNSVQVNNVRSLEEVTK